MSRSRRRHPFTGWTKAKSDRYFKRLASRKVRHANKVRLEQDCEWFFHTYELTDPYLSNKDGRMRFDPDEFPAYMRK